MCSAYFFARQHSFTNLFPPSPNTALSARNDRCSADSSLPPQHSPFPLSCLRSQRQPIKPTASFVQFQYSFCPSRLPPVSFTLCAPTPRHSDHLFTPPKPMHSPVCQIEASCFHMLRMHSNSQKKISVTHRCCSLTLIVSRTSTTHLAIRQATTCSLPLHSAYTTPFLIAASLDVSLATSS